MFEFLLEVSQTYFWKIKSVCRSCLIIQKYVLRVKILAEKIILEGKKKTLDSLQIQLTNLNFATFNTNNVLIVINNNAQGLMHY